jgi:hypothetical protein
MTVRMFADQPTLVAFGGPIKGGDESGTLIGPIVYCPRCSSANTEQLSHAFVVERFGSARFGSAIRGQHDVPTYHCRACDGEFALL